MARPRFHCPVSVIVLSCLLLAPVTATADGGRFRNHSEPSSPWRARVMWMLGGALVTTITYALPCAATGETFVCVPVAGPIYEGGRRVVTGDAALGIFDPLILVGLGWAQAVGPAMLTAGIIGVGTTPAQKESAVAIVPIVTADGAGLRLVGTW